MRALALAVALLALLASACGGSDEGSGVTRLTAADSAAEGSTTSTFTVTVTVGE